MKRALLVPIICSLSTFASAQLVNLDLENWYTDSLGKQRLVNWEHFSAWPNTNNSGSMLGTWKDSNAEHGMYALKLSRWYSYTNDWVRQKASISFQPSALKGYYEYIDDSLAGPYAHDTARVQVFLTKWNISLNRNDTVGTGYADLTKNTSFTAFNCQVNYTSTAIPDSITIHILPTKWAYNGGICATGGLCSYLTIDNLSIDISTSVSNEAIRHLKYYPNPVKNELCIQDLEPGTVISIYDIVGRRIYSSVINEQKAVVNTSAYNKGTYIIEMTKPDGRKEMNKLVK